MLGGGSRLSIRCDLACGGWTTSERKGGMTGKADFAEDEWRIVLEGPPSAGMIVATAQRGGTFRETLAIAKAYVEARKHHGESELLDEIVSAKPEIDPHPLPLSRRAQ